MKKNLFLIPIILAFANYNAFTQNAEEESNLGLGADIVSRYVWRGLPFSTSPAVQPYLEYAFGNLTLGTWGSYTFAREELQEVDLYVSYALGSFTLTLNDYFNPTENVDSISNYFDWNKDVTGHALEFLASWEGTETLPISLQAGVILYGNDLNDKGNNNYSSYVELGYTFDLKQATLNPFLGMTLGKGLYADEFNAVNVGLMAEKEINITDSFILPISGSFITNPASGAVFFVVGFSF